MYEEAGDLYSAFVGGGGVYGKCESPSGRLNSNYLMS